MMPKRGGSYGKPPSLGWLTGGMSFRAQCGWMLGRLGVPVRDASFATSQLVHLGDYGLVFLILASYYQVGVMFGGSGGLENAFGGFCRGECIGFVEPAAHFVTPLACLEMVELFLGAVGSGNYPLTVGIALCRFVSAPRSNMPAKKDVSFSVVGPSGKGGFGHPYQGKPTKAFNEWEFHNRFCLPNDVSVQLVEGDSMSTEKVGHNSIYFTKEQFNAGLRFHFLSLFKQFLHYTQIPSAFIHPNIVRVLIGCSILNMLFNLDLSLLKGAKGHVLVRGLWVGLMEHPERDFSSNYSLKLLGSGKRDRLVEWVENALFDRLNKLFEIIAIERHHYMLFSARNLLAVVREPQPYVLNIIPRWLPKIVVPGEHFVLKDLPFYEKARKADAKARPKTP
ncbi:hypothetical protein CK203_028091 [Vitis vinifera]|uniref:Uncharacterized protein n=1 Tax=Vitis vinifera TaxID=29760 RepID=A0A438ILX3_VITVI|nr:hypothetical protein CK203_028091 [Vitis vinifera]